MSDNKNVNQDKGLQGNEKIEQAIAALQQEATQEMLAHTLTVIRRRMRENGQFILSVEPPTGDNQLRIGTVKTGDGKVWWAAFTSFEEELKGLGAGSWIRPNGGYFITFKANEGCAKNIVAKAKEAGVVLTGAGAPYPYKKDPKDSVIRIAPTLPPMEELKEACEVFIVCAKLASVEKLLEA